MRYMVLFQLPDDSLGQEIIESPTVAAAVAKAKVWLERGNGIKLVCLTDERGRRYDASGNRVDDYASFKESLSQSAMTEGRICHSTGSNAINRRTGIEEHICRGARQLQ